MNRTTLHILCVAGLTLFAACGSGGGTTENSTGGMNSSGGTRAGGTTGAGNTGGTTGTGSTSATLDADAFGKKYKVKDNELSGWTLVPTSDDPTAFAVYTGNDELVGRIDGAADAYSERGCRVTMYEDMQGPDPQLCTVVAMDFVTNDQANSMFSYQKDNGASVLIPGYDGSVAIAYSTLTGLTAYAHFKAMYFEVQLSGYADQSSSSAVAAQFLKLLESRTN